eukprot:sb/3472354/
MLTKGYKKGYPHRLSYPFVKVEAYIRRKRLAQANKPGINTRYSYVSSGGCVAEDYHVDGDYVGFDGVGSCADNVGVAGDYFDVAEDYVGLDVGVDPGDVAACHPLDSLRQLTLHDAAGGWCSGQCTRLPRARSQVRAWTSAMPPRPPSYDLVEALSRVSQRRCISNQ